jgi:dTDP-4-dehydrorhamnose reductase
VGSSSSEDRLLITGGNGLLGTKLLELSMRQGTLRPVSLSRQPCTNGRLGPFDFYQADIAVADQLRPLIARIGPRWVIHTAAMTDVDGCERDPAAAFQINVLGAEIIARACREVGARLVHLSTEYVFDGRAGPYSETDSTNPISVYGRTKLESEHRVMEHCPDAVVARTTVLFGAAPNVRSNFVTWLVGQLRNRRQVQVVDDQIGSPTLADNLAEMCFTLALSESTGIFHTVGADCIDRFSFARIAASVFELDGTLIRPVSTASLAQTAPRPLRAGLCTRKLQQEFPQLTILTARQGLEALRRQLASVSSTHG